MNKKQFRRTTIYDIARALGIAPSSVSNALNDLPTVSSKIKEMVRLKAQELNYKYNSQAANLRKGSCRTIGVIVPKINNAFFSNVIAGMEDACNENDHHLIICQSNESYLNEIKAVKTLINHNVDCVIISLSRETLNTNHINEIINHHIHLIQFDRIDSTIKSHKIVNDNKIAAYKAVKHLLSQGYKKIALLGGPEQFSAYKDRKEGYLQAIQEAGLMIPYDYVVDEILTTEKGIEIATSLLNSKTPPDAFFTSDYAALGVLKVAASMGLSVPQKIGIMGFANEPFTALVSPSISSVDQNSRELGKQTAGVYFNHILKNKGKIALREFVVESSIIIRASSLKKSASRKTRTLLR